MSTGKKEIPEGYSVCPHDLGTQFCDTLTMTKYCDLHTSLHKKEPQVIMEKYKPNRRQNDTSYSLLFKHRFVYKVNSTFCTLVLFIKGVLISTSGKIYKKISDGYCTCPRTPCMCTTFECTCQKPCPGRGKPNGCFAIPTETKAMKNYKNNPVPFNGLPNALQKIGANIKKDRSQKVYVLACNATTDKGKEILLITASGSVYRSL